MTEGADSDHGRRLADAYPQPVKRGELLEVIAITAQANIAIARSVSTIMADASKNEQVEALQNMMDQLQEVQHLLTRLLAKWDDE